MRKALFNFWGILYHIWFYILVAVPILIALPFLILTTLSERTYRQFFWLARNIWAPFILYGMGCPPRISYEEKLLKHESYMLVANHTSMLDIMLMLRVSKNPFVFVGKKELVNIPLFGFFYKRVCIMVDREDSRSRMAVYRRAQKRLNQGLSICIFPEGGVPEESVVLDSFKEGAFRMSIAHQIRLVPITFLDNKKRLPFTWTKGRPGPLRVKIHSFIDTSVLKESDKKQLSQQVRQIFLQDLEEPGHAQIPQHIRT
ncbi:lysophospholipid acyltransferase family protein [Zeaxanthinibacter enoshimensis]|uniref:lysophospholipid acyltransferase family protein n=1 Tax=Zeaxanthinibacter enoshimensis TaxID=392009 RepID=UPI003567744E